MSSSTTTASSAQVGAKPKISTIPDDALAVVGISCRVPGATSPQGLWENILAKKDLRKKMPKERFNVEAFYHPKGINKGTTNATYGYFLDQDLGQFDAPFFNLSRKEAEAMDPQHRLSLELVYEALEDASLTLEDVAGTNTSVFAGAFTNDYSILSNRDTIDYRQYVATGNTACLQANRVSFFYDLHGPSLTLDTACSSSMVGFHLGAETIRSGNSEMSIIIGSALHYDPTFFINVTDLGMLSADGRCRAWDKKGSGYVRGEGVCVAVLKNAHAAMRDGDPIRAIIRGTGSNHDGTKQGITMPNQRAQEELIRSTFRRAKLPYQAIQFFEAHGTGTQAGDPRETEAIGRVFGPGRDEPLVIGSVKTNIGHLEGASGLAGLFKVIKSLENGKIAPNMHFEEPNPNVKFDEWKLRVPTQLEDWPAVKDDGPRMACINSFGFGGANAHVIVQETPAQEAARKGLLIEAAPQPSAEALSGIEAPQLLVISGHSEASAKANAEKIADYLEKHGEEKRIRLKDIAASLSSKRNFHKFRGFVIASDLGQAIDGLRNLSNWTSKGSRIQRKKSRVGFVFTGQGAQHATMGRQLIHSSPLFRQVLERFDKELQNSVEPEIRPEWSVVEELLKDPAESRIKETQFSQPLCTAIQMATVEQLRAWGLEPDATVGHSSGEVAAAYAAGILSFRDAALVAYLRGYYMGSQSSIAGVEKVPGGMMAVGLTEREARKEIEPKFAGKITVACINSATSMTLAGDLDALAELKTILDGRKVFARQLQVAQAFHSHHMLPLAPGYLDALTRHGIQPRAPTASMFSSVTARKADWKKMDAAYWVKNMVSSVRFEPALIGTLLDETEQPQLDFLVEIGPHPALKGPCKQVMTAVKCELPYAASLARGTPDHEALLATLGNLWAQGARLENLLASTSVTSLPAEGWSVELADPGKRSSEIPSYAWDHDHYWFENRSTRNYRQRPYRHNLLGHPVETSIETVPRWRNYLRLSELPWLEDHKIQDRIIFPGSGYIALAIEGASKHWVHQLGRPSPASFVLENIAIKSALELSHNQPTEIMLEMRMTSGIMGSGYDFSVFSFAYDSGRCVEHCTGSVKLRVKNWDPLWNQDIVPTVLSVNEKGALDRIENSMSYYERLTDLGLQYGPNFRLLKGQIECGPGGAKGLLSAGSLPDLMESGLDRLHIHPAYLDSVFHILFSALEVKLGKRLTESFIPTILRKLTVSDNLVEELLAGRESIVHAFTELKSSRVIDASIDVFASQGNGEVGKVLLSMEGLECTAVGGRSNVPRTLLFRVRNAPSFDLLDEESAANLSEYYRGLSGMVDMLAHQQSCSILAAISQVASLDAILSRLGGANGVRRRFSHLDILPVAGSEAARHWEEESNRAAATESYQGLVSFIDQMTDSKYDLVVLEGSGDSPADVSTLVEERGTVITVGEDAKTWNGLDQLKKQFQLDGLGVWREQDAVRMPSKQITIIMSDKPSKPALEVAGFIEKHCNGDCRRITMDQVSELGDSARMIVSLAGIDTAFLTKTGTEEDKKEFVAFQKSILINGRNVVWLCPGFSLEATNPEQALLVGMARSVRAEAPGLRFVAYDCPLPGVGFNAAKVANRTISLLTEEVEEEEVSERSHDHVALVPRAVAEDELNARLPNGYGRKVKHEVLKKMETEARCLDFQTPGRWNSMVWQPFNYDPKKLGGDQVQIRVHATEISGRDAKASFESNGQRKMGDRCVGVVSKASPGGLEVGDEVVALIPHKGTFQTVVQTWSRLCHKVSGTQEYKAAFCSNIQSLTLNLVAFKDIARVSVGETALIQLSAEGVSPASIRLAEMLGLRPIVVIESDVQRKQLIERLALREEQILDIRARDFVAKVKEATNGSGADVLLSAPSANSNVGKLAECLARFGRHVEMGSFVDQNAVSDKVSKKGGKLQSRLDLASLYQDDRELLASRFTEACQLLTKNDQTLLIAPTLVPASQAPIMMAKHSVGEEAWPTVVRLDDPTDQVPVLPELFFGNDDLFDPSKTYLLVGGLGGLGRSLATWLIRRGARKLCFMSRSGDSRPEAKALVEWLRNRLDDVTVDVIKADISDYAQVLRSLQGIKTELAGIFHAATILRDSPLESMTYDQWQDSLLSKAVGAKNLHNATIELGILLDQFVCFSSAAAIMGSRAQANYVAANTYLDALVQHRRANGLVGTSINAGMIVGVGLVAEDQGLRAIMDRLGFDPVNEEELIFQVENAVRESKPDSTVYEDGVEHHSTACGINLRRSDVYWAGRSKLRVFYKNNDEAGASGKGAVVKLSKVLRQLTDESQRTQALQESFLDKLSSTFGVEKSKIDVGSPLASYGLDSLVAVDLRNWFLQQAEVDVALFDVLGASSILALIQKAAGMVQAVSAADKGAAAAGAEGAGAEVQASKKEQGGVAPIPTDQMRLVEEVPMSFGQERIWTLNNLTEDASKLNLLIVNHVSGNPDPETVEKAAKELQRRNQILRSAFFEGEDCSVMQVMEECNTTVPLIDLSQYEDGYARLDEHIKEMRSKPLDIEEGETHRWLLAKMGEGKWEFALVIHHIVCDAGSTKSFVDQISAIYDCLRTGGDLSSVPMPKVQFGDFSLWERKQMASVEMEPHLDFWRKNLADVSATSKLLPMATVQERPAVQGSQRNVIYSRVSEASMNRMRKVCDRVGVTPFHFFLASLRTFIYRYTGEKDLTFLMIDGTRVHPDIADAIGLFVNLSPLRCNMDLDGANFEDVLEKIRNISIDSLSHREAPFEVILREAKILPTRAHFPLSQILVNYQVYGRYPGNEFHDFKIDDVTSDDISQPVDLSFEAVQESDGLALRLDYSSDLYGDAEAMQRFLDNFAVFISDVSRDHRQPIEEISACSEKELEYQKTNCWNLATDDVDPFEGRSVADQILSHAKSTPDACALVSSDGKRLTYGQLARKAQGLAKKITETQNDHGKVAIISSPSAGMIVAMIASHLSGNGFVVLDPMFAHDRLSLMLEDSNAHTLLHEDVILSTAAGPWIEGQQSKRDNPTKILGFSFDAIKEQEPSKGASCPIKKEDPFYMIYTSGSTGKPKGVLLTQDNTREMLSSIQLTFQLGPNDVFLNQTTASWDISMVQIFAPLCAGATVAVADRETRTDPALLAKFVVEQGVTCTFATPTEYAYLMENAGEKMKEIKDYRLCIFAGERLPARLVTQVYDHFQKAPSVINAWAPSETTVQTTIGYIPRPAQVDQDITIGKPLRHCRHYVCDSTMKPVPVGTWGEICVGGPQVGNYLNRPHANQVTFPENPFASAQDLVRGWTRMCRTGDKGKFDHEGNLAYGGRISGDLQIKLRGIRIDLGEIETNLKSSKSETGSSLLSQVAVAARPIDNAEAKGAGSHSLTDARQLVAFVVPREAQQTKEAKQALARALNDSIAPKLNAYMLPSCYHFVEKLPSTAGGKLYRSALQDMAIEPIFPSAASGESNGDEAAVPKTKVDRSLVATVNDVAEEITKMFKATLKLHENAPVTHRSNFFELGGNSLLLVRLQSRIKRKFGTQLKIATIFQDPRPASLAALLLGEALGSSKAAGSEATSKASDPVNVAASEINYEAELSLVDGPRFRAAKSSERGAGPRNVLFVGADSYIGIHMLESLLKAGSGQFGTVFLLGLKTQSSVESVVSLAKQWKLDLAEDDLKRLSPVKGTLDQPGLGLKDGGFDELANQVGEIFHCGSEISLLKGYDNLRPSNVLGTLELIALAAKASEHGIVPINYMSSWSTLHIQNWKAVTRLDGKDGELIQSAAAPLHFVPERSNDYGYFKTRWVAEMLLYRAAKEANHSIKVFRSSAAIANRRTKVPEPHSDYIRSLVEDMVKTGEVPHLHEANVVDLIPVDYITDGMVELSISSRRNEKPSSSDYFHLSNPQPMTFQELKDQMHLIRPDGAKGRSIDSDQWFDKLERQSTTTHDRLRVSIGKSYVSKGHAMHRLDTVGTTELLSSASSCPPVTASFIRDVVYPRSAN
ncbi:hypothetical protein IE53DRAFT_370857 [Violaceomyces palustris]|uniref:Uncharacterized protein n=1 Tax=Violaceomyces palustris TaxID=1673888 RepID=A0ACD0NQS1_9BASI|nr:hypothetical protein IE53DRAFT_370857 [Violaceomyces palustris]